MPKTEAQEAKEHKFNEIKPCSREKINENPPGIARIASHAAGPSRIFFSPPFCGASGVAAHENGLGVVHDAEHVGNSAAGRKFIRKNRRSRLFVFVSSEWADDCRDAATWRQPTHYASREISPSFSPGECWPADLRKS